LFEPETCHHPRAPQIALSIFGQPTTRIRRSATSVRGVADFSVWVFMRLFFVVIPPERIRRDYHLGIFRDYFSCLMPEPCEAGLLSFCMLSLAGAPPVVAAGAGFAFIVPRDGTPLVFPLSLPTPWSVGEADGLTLGPD
jgi:hypothetical protein